MKFVLKGTGFPHSTKTNIIKPARKNQKLIEFFGAENALSNLWALCRIFFFGQCNRLLIPFIEEVPVN
jgi:hypothetical protein